MGTNHFHVRTVASATILLLFGIGGSRPAGAAPSGAGFVEPVEVLHTFTGDAPGALFGWAVSELADVDGDGAMEAIVGQPFDGAGGRVQVFSGMTGDPLFTFTGAAGELAGYAIADAGDVDEDGVNDVIVGAPTAPGTGDSGHVYVLSGADGGVLGSLEGEHPDDFFGSAVSSAGDLDRDGQADLLVGARASDATGTDSGRAYVFSGSDLAVLRTLDGEDAGDLFGSATDWTHDLDGDHVPDLIVGAQNAGRSGRGKAYVFSGADGSPVFQFRADDSGKQFGSFFVAGIGDATGDGTPDVYVGDYGDRALGPKTGRGVVHSGEDGSRSTVITGSSERQGLGPGREGGDADGDGLPDLIIGSYLSGDGGRNAGKVQVFSGTDGSLLRTITSTTAFEALGFDAVGLGDVNADGVPDYLVSAARGETVYVISGAFPEG